MKTVLHLWKTMILVAAVPVVSVTAVAESGHTVKDGDTLAKVARRNGVTVGELLKANRGIDPDRISPGQRLVVPGKGKGVVAKPVEKVVAKTVVPKAAVKPVVKVESKVVTTEEKRVAAVAVGRETSGVHTVRAGDSIYKLSRQHGIPVEELLRRNGLEETATLKIGQEIRLGGGSAAVAAGPRKAAVVEESGAGERVGGSKTVVVRSAGRSEYHTVAKGETLASIAEKHNLTLAAVKKANSGMSSGVLKAGQRVYLPGVQARSVPAPVVREDGRVLAPEPDPLGDVSLAAMESSLNGERARTGYRVKEGDSIEGIAREFLLTPAELRSLNRMNPMDRVHAGQYLIVPFFKNREEVPARYGHSEA
jgi:LysM repeat protein